MVEVTLSKTVAQRCYLLHFVNQTGHFGNSFYPPVNVSGSCTLPFPFKPNGVKSLVSGRDIPFSYENEELTVHLEQIGLFDAIHIMQ